MITSEKDLIKEVLKELSKTRFSPQITIKDIFDYIERKYKKGVLFQEIDKEVTASVILKMFQDYFFIHIVKTNSGLIKTEDKDSEKPKQKIKIQISLGEHSGEESFKTAIEILSEIFEDKKVFSFMRNFFEKNIEKRENENKVPEYIVKNESALERFEKALKLVRVRYEKRDNDFLKNLKKMLNVKKEGDSKDVSL